MFSCYLLGGLFMLIYAFTELFILGFTEMRCDAGFLFDFTGFFFL